MGRIRPTCQCLDRAVPNHFKHICELWCKKFKSSAFFPDQVNFFVNLLVIFAKKPVSALMIKLSCWSMPWDLRHLGLQGMLHVRISKWRPIIDSMGSRDEGLKNITGLPVCHHACEELSTDEFEAAYLKQNQPVVIENYVKKLSCSKWTIEYLIKKVGKNLVSVRGMTNHLDYKVFLKVLFNNSISWCLNMC